MIAIAGIYRLRSAKKTITRAPKKGPTISVVIPFRNEAENLPKLIAGLLSLRPSGRMDVIGVDDHSEDNSLAVFENLTDDRSDFRALALTDEKGKKRALAHGINNSSGEYIATMDADVEISPEWLQGVLQKLDAEDGPGMLILPLKISEGQHGSAGFFQMAENLAIQGLGYGLAAFSLPITCNGANLVFKKAAYNECDGYQSHLNMASGDDVFLMQQMVKKEMRIIPFFDASVVAEVAPASSWREVFNQRLRWAGKTGEMNLLATRLVGVVLLFFATSLVVAAFAPHTHWGVWTSVLAWKTIVDVVLIKITETTYNLRLNPLKLALVAIGYVIYLPVVSLLSISLKPKWKGRRI